MNVTVVSDVHASEYWDEVAEDTASFLNPNEQLRRLVEDDHGTLVFNGDSIDYYFAEYERGGSSNWQVFLDVLDVYDGEYYCTLGNHEYRRYASGFDIHGTEDTNVFRNLRASCYKIYGWLKEFASLLMDDVDTLAEYPFERYYNVHVDNRELVFLDTGRDAFTEWGVSKPSRLPDILSSHVASRGLGDDQIDFLNEVLARDGPCFIFLHAPPFFSYGEPERVEVTEDVYKELSRTLGEDYGYDHTGFVENNWAFIKALLESKRNVFVITAHTHAPNQFILDKETRTLSGSSMAEVNKRYRDHQYVKFVSNLPFGAIKPVNKKTGYLTITEDDLSYTVVEKYS